MHLNLTVNKRRLQLIFWTWEDRDHWSFGYGRWPTGSAAQSVKEAGITNFGFHAIVPQLYT